MDAMQCSQPSKRQPSLKPALECSDPTKKRPLVYKVMAVLFSYYFWRGLYQRIIRAFFVDNSLIKAYGRAKDANLVALDGTQKSLMADYIEPCGDMPLILNIGSYN
jgi:hypothetical protein